MKNKISLVLGILLLAVFLTGCNQVPETTSDSISIATTFYPLMEATKMVVGDNAEVFTIVPLAAEPHSFEPAPQDIIKLNKANAFVTMGIEFEEFEEELEKSAQSNVAIIPAGTNIELLEFEGDHHEEEHEEEEHGEHAFEWAGIFDLTAGTYKWSFAKVGGDYADPAMKMVILESNNIESSEAKAESIMESGASVDKKHNDALVARETAYTLSFDETKETTVFTVTIEENGKYVFFTEHMPFEFEAEEHFFKDDLGNDVEPIEQEPESGHGHHHHEGADPHIWLSPNNMKVMATNIKNELVKIDPQNKALYEQNTQKSIEQLTQLDEEYKIGLASCKKNVVLVNHDAFSYLARDYGFQAITISGLSPESEPTPQQIKKLVDEAKEHDLKYIFYEELVDPRVSEAIASEVGAQTLELSPLGNEEEDYFILMRQNLANLKIAMECS